MKKSTRGILLGAGVAAAGVGAAAAASHLTVSKLVALAMDRQEPDSLKKNRSKITGAGQTAPAESALPPELETSETVCIESHDGLHLVGHWVPCQTPRRVVVAMHGWRSNWKKDFGVIAPFLHDAGCAVLYAEQRAQGNSEGDYITFGLLERCDCLRWLHWVNRHTGGDLPVYLAGVSMGATTVLMTAADELPANVRGIVADCGFTSPHAVWKHVVSKNLHLPYTGIQAIQADRQCRSRIDLGTRAYSTVEALRHSRVPILLIHGDKDHFVPVEMAYENFEACRAPKELLIVPGAEHAMSYLVDPEGYQQHLLAFWQTYDAAAAPADFEMPVF